MSCKICLYVGKNPQQLKKHMSYHDVLSAHRCPSCSYSTSYLPSLLFHLNDHHNMIAGNGLNCTVAECVQVLTTKTIY